MASRSILLSSLLLSMMAAAGVAVSAQSPTFGVGRAATAEEIRAWDISIRPDGQELPPGHGTATEGAPLYVSKGCAGCHERRGSGSTAQTLITRAGTTKGTGPCLAPCAKCHD